MGEKYEKPNCVAQAPSLDWRHITTNHSPPLERWRRRRARGGGCRGARQLPHTRTRDAVRLIGEPLMFVILEMQDKCLLRLHGWGRRRPRHHLRPLPALGARPVLRFDDLPNRNVPTCRVTPSSRCRECGRWLLRAPWHQRFDGIAPDNCSPCRLQRRCERHTHSVAAPDSLQLFAFAARR